MDNKEKIGRYMTNKVIRLTGSLKELVVVSLRKLS